MSSIEAGTSVEKAPFKKKRVHELGLDAMFSPKSVALIGATDRPGTAGRATLENLKSSGFAGKLYAVNPNRPEVLGIKAYKSIGEVPGPVDLAVIVTPAVTVPGVVGECVDAEVKAAIVISAGFRERGPEGKALEQQIQQQLQRGEMRLVGPNCLGIINARSGLNATFTPVPAKRGNIAFLSQSGALLTTLLDWSLLQEVGFSAVVSTGSMLDVGWGDLIYHFGDDAGTRSILLYMESVGDARSFLSAAREVALSKPIIVIKAGRSSEAAQAAASHTGALTGSDEVLDAAFQRAGVLRVQRLADLFSMAEVLDKQPRPRGPRLVIVSNAGGPAVLATDALIAEGGELAPLAEETIGALNEFLPSHWSHGNPVDVLGDTDAVSYLKAVEVAAKDASADGVLMIMAPHGLTDAHQVATSLQPFAASCHKTLLASWMGGECALAETASLAAAGIPSFVYPDMAARTFARMWRYNYNLKVLYETPVLEPGAYPAMSGGARACEEMIQRVRSRGRTLLNEFESKQLLAAYGIPVVETRIALTEDEAVEQAAKIG
ncbi:MAG: CoA-binding protein, partial [Terriglobales bacterium]